MASKDTAKNASAKRWHRVQLRDGRSVEIAIVHPGPVQTDRKRGHADPKNKGQK